jgi:secondary thiamine-phosphate synthase enzyme
MAIKLKFRFQYFDNFLYYFCLPYYLDMIKQFEIILLPFERGFHLITKIITKHLPELPDTGLLNIFIKHTSTALTLNENADPTVRYDFETTLNELVPENEPYYTHVIEGADDMPAHIKSAIIGSSVNIPITSGKLNMGIWQGIYLCEFRNNAASRSLVITIYS